MLLNHLPFLPMVVLSVTKPKERSFQVSTIEPNTENRHRSSNKYDDTPVYIQKRTHAWNKWRCTRAISVGAAGYRSDIFPGFPSGGASHCEEITRPRTQIYCRWIMGLRLKGERTLAVALDGNGRNGRGGKCDVWSLEGFNANKMFL